MTGVVFDQGVEAQIDAVVDHVPALDGYRRWVARGGSRPGGDYLFAEPRVRFEPRPRDRVRAHPDLVVVAGAPETGGSTTELRVGTASLSVALAPERVRALLDAIGGGGGGGDVPRRLLEVAWTTDDEEGLAVLLRAAFGRVLFAPEAVADLEAKVSGATVVRFPSVPYAIERAYWENMAAVAARLTQLATTEDAEAFWRELRRCHVVALMGADLDSFYAPPSPGVAKGNFVAPGALLLDAQRPEPPAVRGDPVVLLGGPRVRATALGSETYRGRLEASVPAGDGEDGGGDHEVLPWGEVVWGRGRGDPAPGRWFLPPRPLTPAHREHLFTLWTRRRRPEALADLHWCFVRLHPFASGNQSLAMSLVNHARREVGADPIPHLVLDHWALCWPRARYRRLFVRALHAYASPRAAGAHPFEVQAARATRLRRAMEATMSDDEDVLDPDTEVAALLRG
ncbi:MAG: hypothetical protein AAF715_04070 [Myxococcota bacterium]